MKNLHRIIFINAFIVIALLAMIWMLGHFLASKGMELRSNSDIINLQAMSSASVKEKRSDIPDFNAIKSTAKRKQAFIDFLNPIVEAQNQRIQETRIEMYLAFLNNNSEILCDIAQQFDLECGQQFLEQNLVQRVDNIPNSLVISQAALETGWGTSRFVNEGNNFFGIWCFTADCGLVPNQRDAGDTHEVKAYGNATESVADYFRLLNTSIHYEDFRFLRQAQRRQYAFEMEQAHKKSQIEQRVTQARLFEFMTERGVFRPERLAQVLDNYSTDPNYTSRVASILKSKIIKQLDPKPTDTETQIAMSRSAEPLGKIESRLINKALNRQYQPNQSNTIRNSNKPVLIYTSPNQTP